jgi:tRNA threonylcarbamoyladenosine biosynthesis protein TsaB
MPTILHIDTATERAGVCISQDGRVLHQFESLEQKNHAAFIQPAIQNLLLESGLTLPAVDAVAVTSGPGSYTGLRVGLASAKGICFALDKPLILLNTLKVMASAIRAKMDTTDLVCPMIDARRMEVFTAVYDASLQEILPPRAMILDQDAFGNLLKNSRVHFCGNGIQKFKSLTSHSNVVFNNSTHHARDMVELAEKAFESQSFANLAYSEPFYVKEFFDGLGRSE